MDTTMLVYGITVADTPPPPTPIKKGSWWTEQINKKEVDQTMFDECVSAPCLPRVKAKVLAPMANAQVIGATPIEATQRDYVVQRISQIKDKHNSALRVQFNMDPKNPSTFLELEKAIKDGDYTVDLEKAKSGDARWNGIYYGVTFGKPTDEEGYNAARQVLKIATQKALDKAALRSPDQLEALIEEFEGWTLPTSTTAA